MGILDAMAGALGGAGATVAPAVDQSIQNDSKQVLLQQQADIQAQRDQRVQDFTVTNQAAGFKHEEGMQLSLFGQQNTLQAAGFGHDTQLMNLNHTFTAEQNSLQRDMTQKQIDAQVKIAASNNATALQVAQVGGQISQDKDGHVLFTNRSGVASAVMDPNNPGQPLTGYADLTPAAKAMSQGVLERLKILDTQSVNPMIIGDPVASASLQAQRAALWGNYLNTITLGLHNDNSPASLGKAANAPIGGQTGWDSTTGDTWKNGVNIGKSTTAQQAQSLILGGAGSVPPVGGTGSAPPGILDTGGYTGSF